MRSRAWRRKRSAKASLAADVAPVRSLVTAHFSCAAILLMSARELALAAGIGHHLEESVEGEGVRVGAEDRGDGLFARVDLALQEPPPGRQGRAEELGL